MGEDLKEQLAAAVAKWLKLEGQKAVAVKSWSDKIKAIHMEIAGLSQVIQDGGGIQGSIEDLIEPSGGPTADLNAATGGGLQDCRECGHLQRYHDAQGGCSLPECSCEHFARQPEL